MTEKKDPKAVERKLFARMARVWQYPADLRDTETYFAQEGSEDPPKPATTSATKKRKQ